VNEQGEILMIDGDEFLLNYGDVPSITRRILTK